MTLPRTYWCHLDRSTQVPAGDQPQSLSTIAPGQAVAWIRESVRDLIPGLDRETFADAWSWLGNHPAVEMAVRDLRRGRPYGFALATDSEAWTWTVHPVSVLPLAERCANTTAGDRQLEPVGFQPRPRGPAAPAPHDCQLLHFRSEPR
ncbi:hypothetical protein [Streptomyces sp. NPDC059928]|uniref:hypothetical protein n=1 Tax=unclassified Streptomyces TaxID=2593676 RepID=UPI0036643512